MGLNLCVYRFRDGKYVGSVDDAWDSLRHVGDREFAKQVLNDETKTDSIRIGDPYDAEWYFRPKDVEAWKAWDAAFDCNHGRWSALADLLASDPELYVYQSW